MASICWRCSLFTRRTSRAAIQFPTRASRRHLPYTPFQSLRGLETISQSVTSDALLESLLKPDASAENASKTQESSTPPKPPHARRYRPGHSPHYSLSRAPQQHQPNEIKDSRPSLQLTEALRSRLPLLTSQPPFYITAHVHGKPYLLTQGDSIRLPFIMHGVMPGDILRLNRATALGSRDWTLLGNAARNYVIQEESDEQFQPVSSEEADPPIIGRTEDLPPDTPYPASSTPATKDAGLRKKGPPAYLDDRLFICRAVVTGTEAEPMRVKEKTKRRQRRIKMVKSKHKYTILRVKELSVRSLPELEAIAGSR